MFQTERPDRINNSVFPSNEYYKYQISNCFSPFSSLFMTTSIWFCALSAIHLDRKSYPA